MQSLRRAAMRFARNKTVTRALPNGRKIAVSPDAQLKYLGREFDRDLVEIAGAYGSGMVWDIGANCGVLAFSCEGRVLAVEADPFLAGLLRQSGKLNPDAQVEVLEAAVSDYTGEITFVIAAHGRACNHIDAVDGTTMAGGVREKLTVPSLTLDDLFDRYGAPDLVKIDVEGAEVMVLRGATRLLKEVRPIIYLEMCSETEDDCRLILAGAGYQLHAVAEMNWLCEPH